MEEPPRHPVTPSKEQAAADAPVPEDGPSTFIPSEETIERRKRRWRWIGLGLAAILAIAAVVVMVNWPRFHQEMRQPDDLERVARSYLDALVRQDEESARKLSTVDEPPGIRSVRGVVHQKARDRTVKGSFASLAKVHARIDAEYTYDATARRFTPKNALGIAAETMNRLNEAKEEAEKSGLYDKMQSGDPDDIFDSAMQLGKVSKGLAKILEPKRILPTYKMLIESSKPPLSEQAKSLALDVADSPEQWNALLKRPFWTLRADGPFIYDQAEVTATVTDRLASLGDPPSRLRLKLVRFRLEGIDTGWKVVSARRIQPGEEKPEPAKTPSSSASYGKTGSHRSLGAPPPAK